MSMADKLNEIRASKAGNKIKYNCDKCKDTHIITYIDKDGYERAKDCECMAMTTFKRLMSVSGINAEDVNIGFKDFETFNETELKNAKAIAFKYCTTYRSLKFEKHNSLLLNGLPGRGKTMLGFATCNNLIRDGVPVRYISYRDVITRLKQNITDKDEYTDEIEQLKNVEVLFIDDLFKGRITDSDINIMYELINYRYLKRKPIIVSTEKGKKELIEIDEALGSRIIEMCKGHIIELVKSGNYRLR